jgi:hypothetical protein
MINHWTSGQQRAMMKLIVASTAFTAVAYALAQLIGMIFERDGLANSGSYNLTYLESRVLEYQRWSSLSAGVAIGALASIFLINLATLVQARILRELVVGLWTLPLGIGVLIGGLLCLDTVAILIQVGLHNNPYQLAMVIPYVVGAISLFLLPVLGLQVAELSERAFGTWPLGLLSAP